MGKQETVSARKAAQMLGVSDTAVRNWIAEGVMQATQSRPKQPWRIPMSEVERHRNCEVRTAGANVEEPVNDQAESSSLPISHAKSEVRSAKPKAEPQTANFASSRSAGQSLDEQEARIDRDAHAQELEVLRVKLAAADALSEATQKEHEALRDTIRRSDEDITHLRGLTVQQAESVRNLTEEVKGLTVALHREQERHALAAAPVEEPFREPKPSLMKRFFARNKRPRHVRIGHA
jgi:excisionase family DNA binding protein